MPTLFYFKTTIIKIGAGIFLRIAGLELSFFVCSTNLYLIKSSLRKKKAFIRFRGIGVNIIKVVSKSLANMLNKGIDAALEKNTVLMLHCIENYQPYQQRYQCDVEEEDL
jgi:hypothetical protein